MLYAETDKNVQPSTPTRIGLLTPYGGTNLGDGAIQMSAIEGIRRQLPDAELWGITLNPFETAKRHGIRAFPITGLRVQFYSETLFGPGTGQQVRFLSEPSSTGMGGNGGYGANCGQGPKRSFGLGLIWTRLKRVPLIGQLLKLLLELLRGSVVLHELRHIVTSYRFVRTLDLVVVSGGGQLDETWGRAWGHPYVLFRWAVLARLAGKRFVVVSVGVDKVVTRLSRFFIRTALSLASYRSYRDQDSKKLLEKWSFTKKDACVPDLAFGLLPKMTSTLPLPGARSLIVGISPMAFGRDGSWPETATAVYNNYLSCLAEFAASLVVKGCQVVLFKSSGIDRFAIEDLLSLIEKRWPCGVLEKITVPTVETVDDFLREVDKVDLVVATRLHGVILSHILGKPVFAISYDRKVRTHMQDVAQGKYVLDISSIAIADLDSCFQILESEAETSRNDVVNHVQRFQRSVEKQYEYLLETMD